MMDGIPIAKVRRVRCARGCRPGLFRWERLEEWLENPVEGTKDTRPLWRGTTQAWLQEDDAALANPAVARQQREDQDKIWDAYDRDGIDVPDDAVARGACYVRKITFFAFDFDEDVDIKAAKRMGSGKREDGMPWQLFCFGHTTMGHTPSSPKVRVIFPLLRPVRARQWSEVWDAGARWAQACGLKMDIKTKDPGRLFFTPSYKAGLKGEYQSWINWGLRFEDGSHSSPDGSECSPQAGYPLLDPAWLLRNYGAPIVPVEHRQAAPDYKPSRGRPGMSSPHTRQERKRKLGLIWLSKRSDTVRQQPKGGRSNHAYGAGRFLGNLVYMDLVNDSEVMWWMDDLTRSAMMTGLSEKEARRQVQSGLDDGVKEPNMELENAVQ